MSFLKKLGLAIVKGVGVVSGLWPYIAPQIPQGSGIRVFDSILAVGDIVVKTEAIFAAVSSPEAKTGAEKLTAATPLVAQVIRQSELIAGKEIVNEDLFLEGCKDITSGVAKALNSRKA